MLRRVVCLKCAAVTEVLAASIIKAMPAAASASETAVNFCHTTRHNIPEESHLHTLRVSGSRLCPGMFLLFLIARYENSNISTSGLIHAKL
jgi:hypothetical protein